MIKVQEYYITTVTKAVKFKKEHLEELTEIINEKIGEEYFQRPITEDEIVYILKNKDSDFAQTTGKSLESLLEIIELYVYDHLDDFWDIKTQREFEDCGPLYVDYE